MTTPATQTEIAELEAEKARIAAAMQDRADRCKTMTVAQLEAAYHVDLLATVATIINADLARQWAELDVAIMLAKAHAGAGVKPTATDGPGATKPTA